MLERNIRDAVVNSLKRQGWPDIRTEFSIKGGILDIFAIDDIRCSTHPTLILIGEVKLSTSLTSMYTALGQLLFYEQFFLQQWGLNCLHNRMLNHDKRFINGFRLKKTIYSSETITKRISSVLNFYKIDFQFIDIEDPLYSPIDDNEYFKILEHKKLTHYNEIYDHNSFYSLNGATIHRGDCIFIKQIPEWAVKSHKILVKNEEEAMTLGFKLCARCREGYESCLLSA